MAERSHSTSPITVRTPMGEAHITQVQNYAQTSISVGPDDNRGSYVRQGDGVVVIPPTRESMVNTELYVAEAITPKTGTQNLDPNDVLTPPRENALDSPSKLTRHQRRVFVAPASPLLTGELTEPTADQTPVGTIKTIITQASTTPTTTHLQIKGVHTGVRVFIGETPVSEPFFYLYVRKNGDTARKVKLYRWTARIIKGFQAGDILSFGTSDGRTIKVIPLKVTTTTETPSGVTGTAVADKAGPPLWDPSAAHVVLPTENSAIKIHADGTEKIVFISECSGQTATWTTPRFFRLPESTDIVVRTTCKNIALATYQGVNLTVTAPTGSTVGGQRQTMTFGITRASSGTTHLVTAGSESSFRAKCAIAVKGDEIVLPTGTYTLTTALTQATFVANTTAGNVGAEGIIIRGADGATATIRPAGGLGSFAFVQTGATSPLTFKNLMFDLNLIITEGLYFTEGVLRMENVTITGATGFLANVSSVTTTTTAVIDHQFLFCTNQTASSNCFNVFAAVGAQVNPNAKVYTIGCTIRTPGSSASHVCQYAFETVDAVDYGSFLQNGHTRLLATGGSTRRAKIYAFFTRFDSGARNAGLDNCSQFFTQFTNQKTNISYGGHSYAIGPSIKGNTSGATAALRLTTLANGNELIPYEAVWHKGNTNHAFYISIGGGDVSFSVADGATEAGVRHMDASGGQSAGSFKNLTLRNCVTAWVHTDASSMPATLSHLATLGNTTSVDCTAPAKAAYTVSRNTLDPTVSANYGSATNGELFQEAAIAAATLFPTAAGNCDANGDTTAYDWVGGMDIWGFVVRSASARLSRGARELPSYQADSELAPEFWV